MIFVSLNKKLNNKVLLLILDGWGISSDEKVSAPDIAKTPNYNFLKGAMPCLQNLLLQTIKILSAELN